MNETQKFRAVARIVACFNDRMAGKKVAVLGFAFKEGTDDTRESCSVDLVKGLLREGASASIYGPFVEKGQILKDLGFEKEPLNNSLKICQSAEEACDGSHAVLVATNWDLFGTKPKVIGNETATLDEHVLGNRRVSGDTKEAMNNNQNANGDTRSTSRNPPSNNIITRDFDYVDDSSTGFVEL
jgi:UDP-glucose 6-dehydrogenase